MNDRAAGDISPSGEGEDAPVRAVLVCSLLLTVLLTAGGWYVFSSLFARSVLLGSVLINGSFLLLKTDAKRLTRRIGDAGDVQRDTVIRAETLRFFVNFFARLCVLALVLFVLAAKVEIDVIGLTLGLATVMGSIVLVGLGGRLFRSPNNV